MSCWKSWKMADIVPEPIAPLGICALRGLHILWAVALPACSAERSSCSQTSITDGARDAAAWAEAGVERWLLPLFTSSTSQDRAPRMLLQFPKPKRSPCRYQKARSHLPSLLLGCVFPNRRSHQVETQPGSSEQKEQYSRSRRHLTKTTRSAHGTLVSAARGRAELHLLQHQGPQPATKPGSEPI